MVVLDPAASWRFFNVPASLSTALTSFLHCTLSHFWLMRRRTVMMWARYSLVFPWEKMDMLKTAPLGRLILRLSCASLVVTRSVGGTYGTGGPLISALSPLITLETVQQERGMLLSGDKRLLREGWCKDLLCNQKGNYESLKLILIRLECMCILPKAPKRCTWILTCSVSPIPSAYTGIQSCLGMMMWLTCHLIFWWCGELTTSDLTQQSSLITHVPSYFSQMRQKNHCTIRCIIGLQHLTPRMMNQHGLNEEKNLVRKKIDLSIESSEVTHVVSLDTNNQRVRV